MSRAPAINQLDQARIVDSIGLLLPFSVVDILGGLSNAQEMRSEH